MAPSQNKKQNAFPASTFYLQIVGSGAQGAPRALYVFAEHCRYLFNCGEGTQRLANEHKVKLGGLKHVFVTQNSWENVGGMPGMLLTLQDTGTPLINVYGPPGIDFIYHDTKNFMRFNNLDIEAQTFSSVTDFKAYGDGPLRVKIFPIFHKPSTPRILSEDDCLTLPKMTESIDLFCHERNKQSNQRKETRSTVRTSRQEMFKHKDLSLCYVCQIPPQLGALLPERCKKLGVPKGPLFGQLKLGQDVTLADGTVVKSTDVTTPEKKGSIFIVLEVPTKEHLSSLLSSSDLTLHQTGDDAAEVVVHFTPPNVMKHSEYKKWINKFPKSTKHIIVNEDSTCMGSERVHKVQYKLNHLYPSSFPLLQEKGAVNNNKIFKMNDMTAVKCSSTNYKFSQYTDSSELEMYFDIDGQAVQAFSMMAYHLRPNLGFEFKTDLSVTPDAYIEECHAQAGFTEAKAKINAISSTNSNTSQKFPNIVFLGTGSCIPNKTRNTSGILVNISPSVSIIMDCGEGTYGQLVRMFGLKETMIILRHVKAIYVSHLHADHHIGLMRLLVARKEAYEGKTPEIILLLAPDGIMHYLESLDIFQSVLAYVSYNDNYLLLSKHTEMERIRQIVCDNVGLERITTCYVPHCPKSYGVTFTTKDGLTLTYSGDTMPSEDLITMGQGSDILIHEATMEDSLAEDAKYKRHSTVSQAIDVGVKMKAKNVILTHFSQRYSKVPLIESLPPNVSIAFDNMQVHMSDLDVLPHLYDALVKMFSEDYDEMLVKTEKKRKAKEALLKVTEQAL